MVKIYGSRWAMRKIFLKIFYLNFLAKICRKI